MKYIKIKKGLIGLIVSFLLFNIFCYGYDTRPGVYIRNNAATSWIYEPGRNFYSCREGFGHVYIDKNGYPNMSDELAESYILMLGPSYLEGDQIKANENVSKVLDDMYGGNNHVYNMGLSGNYFCSTVHGFKAAMDEFPNADAIVILLQLDLPYDLDDVLNQNEYSEYTTGAYLKQSQTMMSKIKKKLGRLSPGLKQLQYRTELYISDVKNTLSFNTVSEKDIQEITDIRNAYSSMLSLIRQETDVPIIIVHFPLSHISDDGIYYEDKWEYLTIFKEECTNNGIDFLSVEDAFYEAYRNEYIIPYGFINSEIGSGHLNKYGHRILAEEIYKALEKKGICYK